ncbi:unnamed protein product [Periconia digitata]|uniref:Uncharacterized protein n=1 Tax=Periconia digitata TaxID=1303443 RepID=A0A9W4XSF4_9PLEO|nr:unnamed protein product [Periconia digitata]
MIKLLNPASSLCFASSLCPHGFLSFFLSFFPFFALHLLHSLGACMLHVARRHARCCFCARHLPVYSGLQLPTFDMAPPCLQSETRARR